MFRSLNVTFSLVIALSGSARAAAPDADIQTDVVYGHKDGMALTMDVFRPAKDANGVGVLFMVSGGWVSRWMPPERAALFVNPLLSRGFTVITVRHGSSPKYKIPEIVEDVRRSVRFVRSQAEQWQIDPDRLGVYGMSAGGHLSLVLGSTADQGDADASDATLRQSSRVAAVVAYFPPTDLRSFVNPSSPYYENFPALQFDANKAPDYSPVLHVTPDDAPTLLIHGDVDQLVPVSHSRDMYSQLQKLNVASRLLIIEGAAHGFKGDNANRATEALVSWFEKHLLEKSE